MYFHNPYIMQLLTIINQTCQRLTWVLSSVIIKKKKKRFTQVTLVLCLRFFPRQSRDEKVFQGVRVKKHLKCRPAIKTKTQKKNKRGLESVKVHKIYKNLFL